MIPAVHHIQSREALADGLCDHVGEAVLTDVSAHGHATLMLSGGSTPKAAYAALSRYDLPWEAVQIGLVDDRWVDETDAGSNAAMIRRTLLQNKATQTTFLPMKIAGGLVDAQAKVGARYGALPRPYSLVVLGMGPDGHTASWFPGGDGTDAALDPKNPSLVQAVTAKRSDVTGDYLDRMTLTLSAISDARRAVLLITGAEKRAVFERARTDATLPVHHAITTLGARLVVLYAD